MKGNNHTAFVKNGWGGGIPNGKKERDKLVSDSVKKKIGCNREEREIELQS